MTAPGWYTDDRGDRRYWDGHGWQGETRAPVSSEPGFVAAPVGPAPQTPAGWYPDTQGASRYWDGVQWTQHVAPASSIPTAAAQQGPSTQAVVGTVVLLLAIVGVILSFQSVSLLSGMGNVWTGMALAVVAAIASIALRYPRRIIKIVCVVLALLAITSAVYDKVQLDHRRSQLDQIFNTP